MMMLLNEEADPGLPQTEAGEAEAPAELRRGSHSLAMVGLGELLWDLLPEGRQLGGAPANFAVMASRLGAHGVIASRIGLSGDSSDAAPDELGAAALETLSKMPVDTRYLQRDTAGHPTGSVSVAFRDGQPTYTIHEPVAWDYLAMTPAWRELAARADAVCFGVLAQRGEVSRATIHAFLDATRPECVRVFDINIRKPFVTAEAVCDSIGRATILKLNDGEMVELLELTGLAQAAEGESEGDPARVAWLATSAQRLLDKWPIKLVAITLGPHGSLLVSRDLVSRHEGIPTKVVDTVGAGDAFTAALTTYYLRAARSSANAVLDAEALAVLNEAGNRWGSWVASQAGAMPQLPDEVRERLSALIAAAGSRG